MIEFRQLTRRAQIRRLRVLAQHAIAEFGLESATLSLLGHFDNTTFAVTEPDGSRYLLRIHRPDADPTRALRRRSRIESELWWLDRLRADLQLSVPMPERTAEGEGVVYIAVDGVPQARYCTLFHWMEGRFLFHRLRSEHLERVGRLMARLHKHSTQLTVPTGFDRRRVDNVDERIEEGVVRLFTDHWSAQSADVMRDMFQRVREVQEELGSGSETFGLIHADIHQNNYMFHNGEVRFIDFDDCGWGHYLYDLAVTAHQIGALPHVAILREALLTGYRQVRDLSPAHERMMDTICMLRELQDIASFLRDRDDPTFSKWTSHIGEGVQKLERFLAQT